MEQPVLLWILGVVVTVLLGLCVAFYTHVRDCKSTVSKLADHGARISALERVER
jgi:cytochrome c-type biogenesis protein CcmH/NrfF